MNFNNRCVISGCIAHGEGDSGTYKSSASGGGIGYRVAVNCIISNNICERNWQNGINPGSDTTAGEEPYGNLITGNICRNNNVGGGSGWGGIFVYVDSAATHRDCVVSNNICYDDQGTPTQKYGIRIATGVQKGHLVIGNHCYGHAEHGITFAAQNSFIKDNVCRNNGRVSNGDGINVSGAADMVISGNVCSDDQTTETQRYGIYCYGGGSARHIVSNNKCKNNKQDGIYLDATSNSVLTGNHCHENGQATVTTYAGIKLNNTTECTVVGNRVHGAQQDYGVETTGTSNYNNVSANVLRSNGTGATSLAGANNEVAGANIT